MATVQETLTETPRPTWFFRPGYQAPLPQGMTLSRPSAGRTLDPTSGLYTSVPSGEKRVFGPQQGLLVESDSRTNRVRYSSRINTSRWSPSSIDTETARDSILDNAIAHELKGDGTSADARVTQNSGSLRGGNETAYVLVEKASSDLIALGVKNSTDNSWLSLVEYDWSTGGTNVVAGSVLASNTKILRSRGPNGAELALFALKVSSSNSSNDSGDSAKLTLYPDRNANGNSAIFHHAQFEVNRDRSSPISTGSFEVTREGDNVTVDLGDAFNSNGGTLLVNFTLRSFFIHNTMVLAGLPGGGKDYLNIKVGTFLSTLESYDGNSTVSVAGKIFSFQKNKTAISVTPNERRLAANGNVQVGSHNGSLLTNNTIKVGRVNRLLAVINRIDYIPKALSEFTLETLTS